MIYITGDTHGDFRRFGTKWFKDQKEMTKDDTLIILGDFGGIWDYKGESEHEKYQLDWLEGKNYTTVFIDGNHECVSFDSEILTEYGWMNIKDVYNAKDHIRIANVNLENGNLYYDYPINKICKFSKTIINIDGVNYKQSITPNHDVIIDGKKIKAKQLIGKEIFEEQLRCKICNCEESEGISLSNIMIEILTSIVMDATIVDYSIKNPNSRKIRIQYHFKKERKIIYIMNILDDANIHYTVRKGKYNDTFICIHGDDARYLYRLLHHQKELPFYFTQMNLQQFKSLFHALIQTDGTLVNNNVIWHTTSKNDVDIIQELCVKHNYDMRVKIMQGASGYTKRCKKQYHCSFGFSKNLHRRVKIEEVPYNNLAYCFTMPHGTLITRYKNCFCVTGNCFPRIYEYPVKEWNGGLVHEIRPSVLHLMRGEIFTIEGLTFWAFGGASSHDIRDGILDPVADAEKIKEWYWDYSKLFRVKGVTWWPEELPTDEEMKHGIDNLAEYGNKVDYLLTHSPATSILNLMGRGMYTPDKLSNYLDDVRANTEFKRHYMGHMHLDWDLNETDWLMYEEIVRIN